MRRLEQYSFFQQELMSLPLLLFEERYHSEKPKEMLNGCSFLALLDEVHEELLYCSRRRRRRLQNVEVLR